MFGIGGDDDEKDKLKENMEEIKDLIDNEAQQNQDVNTEAGGVESLPDEGLENSQSEPSDPKAFDQPEMEGFQPDQSQDQGQENQEGISGLDQELPQQSQESQTQPVQKSQQSSQQNQQRTQQQPAMNEQQGQPIQPGKQSQPNNSQQQETSADQRSSRDLDQQIPEPPKTKKLDVPEIEKGPLFIKRQKFESAQRMIQEMKQISVEIDQVVNRLQKGIEQDRQTEREAKELLHDLEDDRKGVKHIVSPEES